jgi:hypothetical protein
MPRIAIPQVRDDRPAVEYRIRLDPKLNDELALYGRLYQETYGQPIDPKALLEPIVRRFLATDRELRRFRRAQVGGSPSVAGATRRKGVEGQ